MSSLWGKRGVFRRWVPPRRRSVDNDDPADPPGRRAAPDPRPARGRAPGDVLADEAAGRRVLGRSSGFGEGLGGGGWGGRWW